MVLLVHCNVDLQLILPHHFPLFSNLHRYLHSTFQTTKMVQQRARDSTSPTPEAFPRADQSYAGNLEEIQPLPFETEAELFSVLARLREGLRAELGRKWLAEGGDPEGIEAVEGLVLKVRLQPLSTTYDHSRDSTTRHAVETSWNEGKLSEILIIVAWVSSNSSTS